MRLQRDALGQLTHEELAPGLNRQLRYNSDGLLTEQSLHAGNQGLFATRYDYDRAGNLTSRHDSAFGKDTYLYDPMGRILKHTDPQGVLHEFFNDPAGDRLITQVSGSGSASTVVGRNDEWQRQGSYQGTHYRFDRAGNLTHKQDSQQLLELAWDANQRLIASRRTAKEAAPSVTTYGYDPLGRRLFKETQGQRTWFGWDGDAMTLDVIDGQAREFIYRPETFEPLAVLGQTAQGQALGTLHYVNDPNGCPTRLIDGQGQVLWAASYSAWGAIDKLHASTVSNPIRLQGQYEDGETGLYYNRNRYYEPNIGCFAAADPLGLQPGPNTYSFAPNTYSWTDPLGLTCSSDAKKLGKNLGSSPTPEYRAHHIVMSNSKDPRMVALRNKMSGWGIDINDPKNGIWLPKNASARQAGTKATAHAGEGVHGLAYKQHVFDTLSSSSTKEEFTKGLSSLKSELYSGKTFPTVR
jgi:RHS repeat-associated protein